MCLRRLLLDSQLTCRKGATISNDGTSHRNQHYTSHHITLKMADGLVRVFNAGLKRVPTKSSDQQLSDWQELLEEAWDMFNSSPLGSAEQMSAAVFLRILCGTTGDHASDQLKLNRLILLWKQATDRLERGHGVIDALPDLQYQSLVAEVSLERIGILGDDVWDGLSEQERETHIRTGLDEVAVRLGWESFNQLDPRAQASVDFFYHFGCEMHKELNTVVAGNKALQEYWTKSGLPGPIKLPNKDKAAAMSSGSSATLQSCPWGGAKFIALLGAYLRNKDSKKGCQRFFNTWMSAELGATVEFPDVARSRFQSTCLAAGFVIRYTELLIRFMELMRDSKDTPGFNNMEKNIYNALHDPYTLTDCAVLAAYPHLVTIPYICDVRRPGVNALDLSSKHVHVRGHCRKLGNDPGLFLDAPLESSHTAATLDGQPYHDGEVMASILRRFEAGELPSYRGALSAFLLGAADGWDHFASEFNEGSVLATASASDLARSHADATNDRNEHGLGSARRDMLLRPNSTTESVSSRLMFRDNDTRTYVGTLSKQTLDALLPQARAQLVKARGNPEGVGEIARMEQNATQNREKAALAKERQSAFDAKLDTFSKHRIRDPSLITKKMTMKMMEPELEWHRYRGLPDDHPDKIPKVKARLAKADQQRDALIRTITALHKWESEGKPLHTQQADVEPETGDGLTSDFQMDIDED